MHATLNKFGYPETLLLETDHWCVLLRPQQITLAALVLAAKSGAGSFADLPGEAYGELQYVTRRIENTLRKFRAFDKINYVMLMMVDPHVHFHVLPRYASPQTFEAADFVDAGWPGPPDFKSPATVDAATFANLLALLKNQFAGRD